jgi:hypothetical protein
MAFNYKNRDQVLFCTSGWLCRTGARLEEQNETEKLKSLPLATETRLVAMSFLRSQCSVSSCQTLPLSCSFQTSMCVSCETLVTGSLVRSYERFGCFHLHKAHCLHNKALDFLFTDVAHSGVTSALLKRSAFITQSKFATPWQQVSINSFDASGVLLQGRDWCGVLFSSGSPV